MLDKLLLSISRIIGGLLIVLIAICLTIGLLAGLRLVLNGSIASFLEMELSSPLPQQQESAR